MSQSTGRNRPAEWPGREFMLRSLKRFFALEAFRPGQEPSLQAIMGGRNLLAVMPTGSGKSLCYQLPAFVRPGLVVVVSPLVALMKDQVDALKSKGLPACRLSGDLPRQEMREALCLVAGRKASLLYLAPERLRSRRVRDLLKHAGVWMVAVDEAHCISMWGHDFRPDYRLLGGFVEELRRPQLAAFTATATPPTRGDIAEQLGMRAPEEVLLSFDRPELFLEVRQAADDAAKLDLLAEVVSEIGGPAIIYCGSRRTSEMVAAFVRTMLEVPARAYHAGMPAEHRKAVQEAFFRDEVRVIAATTAFGLGIDKPDIRAVIHYEYPGSLEQYYQEAGRAGRDGKPARCVLIYAEDDADLHEYFIQRDRPPPELLRALYDALPAAGPAEYADLAKEVNRPEEVVEQAVGQLALLGCVALADVGRGAIETAPGGQPLSDATLAQYAAEVEELRYAKRGKVRAVRAYALATDCRRRELLAYLGEEARQLAPCCDVCATRQTPPEARAQDPLGRLVMQCVEELPIAVGRTTIAHILRGSRSKKVQRVGGPEAYAYGRAHQGEAEILARIDRMIADGVLVVKGRLRPVLEPGRSVPVQAVPRVVDPHGLGATFLKRGSSKRLECGGFTGWALTSYWNPSGHSKTELGDHLQAFKYRQKRERGEVLAQHLLKAIRSRSEFAGAEVVAPIPGSLKGRDFDPAAELAKEIERHGGPAALLGGLAKTQDTRSQKELQSSEGRRENLAGAFAVGRPERVKGRKVIVLDDFVDSGTTMAEAGRTLVEAGAREVVLLAVATTGRRW
jgi:ATP-dependent DNA helicase RecQ